MEGEVIAVQVVMSNRCADGKITADYTATVGLLQGGCTVVDSACGADIVTAIWDAVARCFGEKLSIDSVRISTRLSQGCIAVLKEREGGGCLSETGAMQDFALTVTKVIVRYFLFKKVKKAGKGS